MEVEVLNPSVTIESQLSFQIYKLSLKSFIGFDEQNVGYVPANAYLGSQAWDLV